MWTLPNVLTMVRIAAIPLLVAAIWPGTRTGYALAFALFALAAVTDWFDGRIARARGQISALGVFLDPIADKLMVAAVLVMLVAQHVIAGAAVVAALAILLRELTVSGLREYLGPFGVKVPVSPLAKWKTAAQMAALALLLLAPALAPGSPVAHAGTALLWVAALLTLVTGWGYLRVGLAHMRA